MADEKKTKNEPMARAKAENWPSFGRDVTRQSEPMARAMMAREVPHVPMIERIYPTVGAIHEIQQHPPVNSQWTAEQRLKLGLSLEIPKDPNSPRQPVDGGDGETMRDKYEEAMAGMVRIRPDPVIPAYCKRDLIWQITQSQDSTDSEQEAIAKEVIAKKTSQAMQELGVTQALLKRTKEDLEDARSAKQIGRALKKAQVELERAKAEMEQVKAERDRALVEIEQLRERIVKQESEAEGWHDDMCRRTDEWISEIQKLRSERDRMQGERDQLREKRDQALTGAERLRAELNRNEQYRFEGRISAANWKKIAQEAQEEARKAKDEAEAQREHYKQTFLDAAKADVEKQESSEETEQSCGNELEHGGEDYQEEPKQRSPFWVLCSFFLPLLWYGLRPGAREIRRALAASTRKSGETPISKPQERAQASNIESKRRLRRRRR